MSQMTVGKNLGYIGVTIASLLAWGSGASAQWFGLFGCCDGKKCPPPYVHCQEGPPCLKYKKACPKPVCDPCHLRHWGYYQNCWHPWPWPTNWACSAGCPNTHPNPEALPGPAKDKMVLEHADEPGRATTLPEPQQPVSGHSDER